MVSKPYFFERKKGKKRKKRAKIGGESFLVLDSTKFPNKEEEKTKKQTFV